MHPSLLSGELERSRAHLGLPLPRFSLLRRRRGTQRSCCGTAGAPADRLTRWPSRPLSASKPTALWVPSQNGRVRDFPQRQSATILRPTSISRPSWPNLSSTRAACRPARSVAVVGEDQVVGVVLGLDPLEAVGNRGRIAAPQVLALLGEGEQAVVCRPWRHPLRDAAERAADRIAHLGAHHRTESVE